MTFITEIAVTDEITAGMTVEYSYHRGYAKTREQPGEPSYVEIESVRWRWLHIDVGYDLEVLREQRNEADAATTDAWILAKCERDLEDVAYEDWMMCNADG